MSANRRIKRILNVALIQMCPAPFLRDENLRLALKLAKSACKKGADLIIFPELFDSGYCVSSHDSDFAMDFAKPQKHATFKVLSDFASTNGIHIVACGIEKAGGNLFDTAYIIAPSGTLVGKHRKIYLWGDEKSRFSSGKKYEVFKLNFGDFSAKVGLQICYEIGFGVGANILALKGAEVLIYPSAFGAARAYNWDLLSRARAVENGCFVLACNHSGEEVANSSLRGSNATEAIHKSQINSRFDASTNHIDCHDFLQKSRNDKEMLEFAGDSRIISPQGKIIKKATKLNEAIIARIDLDEIYSQREAIPYLKDFDTKLTKRSFGKST